MLNCLIDEVRVDTINDNHGPTGRGDVELHSDHAVLDVAHDILQIKTPLLIVVVPGLVQISADWWEGSAIWTQHHLRQQKGASPGKHEHGRDQGTTPPSSNPQQRKTYHPWSPSCICWSSTHLPLGAYPL